MGTSAVFFGVREGAVYHRDLAEFDLRLAEACPNAPAPNPYHLRAASWVVFEDTEQLLKRRRSLAVH